MNRAEQVEFVATDLERAKRRGRRGLVDFTQYTKHDYQVAEFHRIVAEHLELVLQGKIKRLMVFGPPQHGKSEMVSRRFPAYAFGKRPSLRIIGASYAGSLAREMNLDIQGIMDSEPYAQLFPAVKLNGRRNSDLFDIPDFGGRYKAAGVGMGITGKPADLGIIDDPIKDYQEASSQKVRDNLWNWYTTTFRSRIQKGGAIILTQTRWHEDDLAGRLLELAKRNPKADQWVVLRFEALRETPPEDDVGNDAAYLDTRALGEPLADFRYDVESLVATRESVGPRVWQSVYQGSPTEQKGAVILREWCVNFYRKHELPLQLDMKVTSFDLNFKEGKNNDFVSGTAWGRKGARFYLLGPEEYHERSGFSECVAAFKLFALQHQDANQHLVENKANGPALENVLKKEITRLLLVEPLGSKIARAQATEGLWAAGNVWLPHPDDCPWILAWIEEIVGYPNKAKDDRVDSMSQALTFLDGKAVGVFPKRDNAVDSKPTFAGPLKRGATW